MTIVKPVDSPDFERQMSQLDREYWSVARLAQLSRDFPVFDLPITHINVSSSLGPFMLREFAGHVKAVNDADMTKPIIMDEDGRIMDGRHRILNAIVNGLESVKAVRFEKNPTPCRVDDE